MDNMEVTTIQVHKTWSNMAYDFMVVNWQQSPKTTLLWKRSEWGWGPSGWGWQNLPGCTCEWWWWCWCWFWNCCWFIYISLIIIMQYQDSPQIRMSRANHLKSGSCSCRYSLYQDHCLKNKKMWLMCLLLFLNHLKVINLPKTIVRTSITIRYQNTCFDSESQPPSASRKTSDLATWFFRIIFYWLTWFF